MTANVSPGFASASEHEGRKSGRRMDVLAALAALVVYLQN